MLIQPQVAGTIAVTPKTVAQIQGIQFQAQAKRCRVNKLKMLMINTIVPFLLPE